MEIRKQFTTWLPARKHALAVARHYGLDVAIRRVKEYGKQVFNVSLASHNDSDYARAEIVRPSDKI